MRTSAILALVAWMLVLPPASMAEAPATVFLEELTWMEVRDLVRSGTTTIILPTGGTEQNGPHMALGKHNVRVKALGATIARTLGGTLVAPVLAYVPEGGLAPPTGHMRYAGTITVPEPVFEGVLSPRPGASPSTDFATSCSSGTAAATRRDRPPWRAA